MQPFGRLGPADRAIESSGLSDEDEHQDVDAEQCIAAPAGDDRRTDGQPAAAQADRGQEQQERRQMQQAEAVPRSQQRQERERRPARSSRPGSACRAVVPSTISRGLTAVVRRSCSTPRSRSPASEPARTAGACTTDDRQQDHRRGRRARPQLDERALKTGRTVRSTTRSRAGRRTITASNSPTRVRTTISQPRASARRHSGPARCPSKTVARFTTVLPAQAPAVVSVGFARARQAARVGGRVRNQSESAG